MRRRRVAAVKPKTNEAALPGCGGGDGDESSGDVLPCNAVTALLVCLRHERRLLWIYSPLVTGLVVATVYLRFHWAIDVAAGAALAVLWQIAVVRLVEATGAYRPANCRGQ